MLRAYIGCFGSGLGHAMRMLQVADRVREAGGVVRFSSSSEAAHLIRTRGYQCNELPLADVSYSASGEFSLGETMKASPLIFARTCRQVLREVRSMVEYDPSVVLSDSSLPTLLAARALSRPVFTVVNQLSLTGAPGDAQALKRLLSAGTSTAMKGLWGLSDEVLLPDLPPPYTISERNLWGGRSQRARYVGFLARPGNGEPDGAAMEFGADRRMKVFWQVSGPPATRGPFLKLALEAAAALSDRFVFVLSAGDPAGAVRPERIPGGWCYGWCRAPEAYFQACDLVVARAGHGTVSQTLAFAKPSVLVPIPRQPEQLGNAMKAESLGVAVNLSQGDLSPRRLSVAIESLLGGRAVERARELKAVVSRFDAAGEIVRTLASASP